MNVADACFHTVHDAEGGAESLGPRIGKRGTSLSGEVKVRSQADIEAMKAAGATVPKLGILDAQRIMKLTRDYRILNAQAAELGGMVVMLPELDWGEMPAAADVAAVAKGFSDLMSDVALSLADGRVTDRELAKVEREVGMLVATTQRLLTSLGRMNALLRAEAPGAAK